MRHSLTVQTSDYYDIIDLTDRISALTPAGDSACSLFMQHTSAALTIASLEDDAPGDIKAALQKMVPQIEWRHLPPEHTPGHVLSAIIGVSLTVPVTDGHLALGPFQRVVLLEFQGPSTRSVAVDFWRHPD